MHLPEQRRAVQCTDCDVRAPIRATKVPPPPAPIALFPGDSFYYLLSIRWISNYVPADWINCTYFVAAKSIAAEGLGIA